MKLFTVRHPALPAVACLIGAAGLLAQVTIRQIPIESTDAGSGAAMYEAYCSSCHGLDGKGNGPASAALKIPATDLTRMAKDNGGPFPALQVMNTLGLMPGTTPAHGSEDMPVWGTVFRSSGQSPTTVQLRLYNMTRYLDSIQNPPSTAAVKTDKPKPLYVTDINAGSGSSMFQSYCASCHGSDGRGAGPAAVSLKAAVPDLSLLAKHNHGKYPELRVMNALGWQRGMEAHGSKEMPVWGNLMRESHEGDGLVHIRLRNITRYIETLQR